MARTKYTVCPACEGEGYVSRIKGAFGASDLDEWFGDDWDERDAFVGEYTTRGGAYDEPCSLCSGDRVVTQEQIDQYEYQLQADAERAAEMRMGC